MRENPPLIWGRTPTPGLATVDDYVADDLGHWLAGLTDGEGCFYIGQNLCSFTIKLRDDDAQLIEDVREQLGGIGRVSHTRNDGGTRRPQVRWDVNRKAELVWLTRLFDAFPLRSKKARDYAIWREAVIDWACGAPPSALAEPRDRLRETRAYREVARA